MSEVSDEEYAAALRAAYKEAVLDKLPAGWSQGNDGYWEWPNSTKFVCKSGFVAIKSFVMDLFVKATDDLGPRATSKFHREAAAVIDLYLDWYYGPAWTEDDDEYLPGLVMEIGYIRKDGTEVVMKVVDP